MSNSDVTLTHGDEYIVFYKGGPYDGRNDTRIATSSGWDDEVTVLVALDGKETQLVYAAPVAKVVGEQTQVTYTWDQLDSEPIEDGADRVSEE
jgi:hypothetical protein